MGFLRTKHSRYWLTGIALAASITGCAVVGPTGSMQHSMGQILAAENELSAIWPGYAMESRNLAVYKRGHGILLLSGSDSVQGFQPFAERVPGSTRLWFSTSDSASQAGAFHLGAHVGGVTATAARDDLGPLVLLHEDFHAFQSEQWSLSDGVRLHPFNGLDPAAIRPLLNLESQVLIDAWKARGAARESLLLDYLALRAVREELMSEEQVAAERHFELVEGTATYFEVKASQVLGISTNDRIRTLRDLMVFDGSEPLQQHIRQKSYGAGLKLCMLLDRLPERHHWKSRLAQQRTGLSELATEAMGVTPGALRIRGQELLADRGWPISSLNMVGNHSVFPAGIDSAEYAWYLAFMLPVEENTGLLNSRGSVSFRRGGILHIDEQWTLVPFPQDFSVLFADGHLRVKNHPVMSREVSLDGQSVIEVIILLADKPGIDNGGLEIGSPLVPKKSFKSDGIHLSARDPVQLEFGLRSELERRLIP